LDETGNAVKSGAGGEWWLTSLEIWRLSAKPVLSIKGYITKSKVICSIKKEVQKG
jgi:hypothetical protein